MDETDPVVFLPAEIREDTGPDPASSFELKMWKIGHKLNSVKSIETFSGNIISTVLIG
jgi:hypothetical protein